MKVCYRCNKKSKELIKTNCWVRSKGEGWSQEYYYIRDICPVCFVDGQDEIASIEDGSGPADLLDKMVSIGAVLMGIVVFVWFILCVVKPYILHF